MNGSATTPGLTVSPHWPYLAAAAVLTDFAVEKLKPLGGSKPDLGKVSGMLMEYGEAITVGPAKGRWSLSNTTRRAAVAELKKQGRLFEALQANQYPDKSDNPTQRAIDDLVIGKQPELSGRSLTDLLGLERAIDLLGPSLETVQNVRPKVLAQLERLRLIEPLQRLVADGFAGRKSEMAKLRSYVDELPSQSFIEWLTRGVSSVIDIFRIRPPMVVYGPGGVGKSTLLAKFLLDHAGPDQPNPIPFIYLDFDRGQLDPSQPVTILQEAFRQIKVQFPDFAEPATSLEADSERRITSEDTLDISRSEHFDLSVRLRNDFVKLLNDIGASHRRNLLFFIDTFEVVQRRGTTPVFRVLKLAAELVRDAPRLRLVIAGRAPLRETDFSFANKASPWKPLPLPLEGFDNEAGRAYLEGRLRKLGVADVSRRALDRIVSLVRGNPLSLRLAAQVFAKEDLSALEDIVGQARFDAAFTQERVQGLLHNRIVEQLPRRLQAIADPGLILRRITPDVIAEVLAGPCELDLKDIGEAHQLFDDLKNEAALFEPLGGETLRHRSDVRLLMLPLLRHKLGERARKIDQEAAAFWNKRNNPEARAEAIYHLLWLGVDKIALETIWQQGPAATLPLEEALDEFEALDRPPAARIWLCRKLAREISPELEQKAELADWEQNAELSARSLLASGAAEEALKALRLRDGRTPASRLWLLELEALKLLGRDEEAFQVVDRALKAAEGVDAPTHILGLLAQKASLFERAEHLHEARKYMSRASKLAHSLRDAGLEFETGLALARLWRKFGSNEEAEALRLQLATMLSGPVVLDTLAKRPALLVEASAEIGDLRPELFIMAAQKTGSDDRQVGVFTPIGLGVAYASRGEFDKAVEILERSLSLSLAIENKAIRATTLLYLGNACRNLGQTNRSIECYQESLSISRERSNRRLEAHAVGNLGMAYAELGDFQRAREVIARSLEIAREIRDPTAVGDALNNLANVYLSLHNSSGATELLEEALAIARKLGDLRGERQILGNLGTCYLAKGGYLRAIELYTQSLQMARELGANREQGIILTNLGGIYAQMGELQRAEGFFQEALQISRKVGDRALEAKTFGNLGIFHRKLGQLDKAGEYYREQLYIVQALGDRLGEGTTQYNLALALDAAGDRESAALEMSCATTILRQIGSPLAEVAGAWLPGAGGVESLNIGVEANLGDFEALGQFREVFQRLVDQQLKQILR